MDAFAGKQSLLFPGSYHMTLASSNGDTLLTFMRTYPDKAFDVPANAQLLILPLGLKGSSAEPIALPVLRPYHTSSGSLLVKAKINRSTLELLRRYPLDVTRVDLVSINETDMEPVTWYLNKQYRDAFHKGVSLFMAQPKLTRQEKKDRKHF